MLDMLGEHNLVALIGLGGGILLGLAARLGRFCTLGAIEDALASRTQITPNFDDGVATAEVGRDAHVDDLLARAHLAELQQPGGELIRRWLSGPLCVWVHA